MMNSSLTNTREASGLALGKYDKLTRWFVLSASGIFLITGSAKIASALFGTGHILNFLDPILGISFHNLMLLAGITEFIIGGFGVLNSKRNLSLGLMLWMGTNLAGYRAGLWYLGWRRPCPCLGNLTDALNISPERADLAMRAALFYVLIGGALSVFWRYSHNRGRNGFFGFGWRVQKSSAASIIIPVLGLLFSNYLKASEYELSGSIQHDRFDRQGKLSSSGTVTFHLNVKDCKWFADIQGIAQGGNFVSCDGKDLYQYVPGPKDAPQDDPNVVISAGTVRRTIIPPAGGFSGPLWIGFASTCYLDELKGPSGFPAVFLGDLFGDETIFYSASITREDAEPKLASSITFSLDPSKSITQGVPGFATYTVNSWTNIGSLKLPMIAELDVFTETTNHSKAALLSKLIFHIDGWHDHSTIETFVPTDIGKYTYITDRRSNDLSLPVPLQYQSDRWLTVDEAKATPAYARLRLMPSVASKATPKVMSRRIVLGVLIISTITMIAVFLRVKKAKENSVS